ncbi:hypothetical protein [Sinomicrobium sp. M5D2P9]
MNKTKLKREIGVFGYRAHMVNMVVDSGIFVLPAIVAFGLGASSVFAYLLCIVLVAFVKLCFAEVGSRVTDPGGAYVYIRTAFGPYVQTPSLILFYYLRNINGCFKKKGFFKPFRENDVLNPITATTS